MKATRGRPKMKVVSIKVHIYDEGDRGDGVRRMNMWEGAGREIFALCQ